MFLVFSKRNYFLGKKNLAMTFSSSLVIYSSIRYVVYLFVFSQTFISFKWTKFDNCARCNLPLLTEKLSARDVP